MPLFLHKIPKVVQRYFDDYTWHVETHEKNVYLTFDDGPVPEITEWVLAQLAVYQAKATFFCVGDNIHKNHSIFQKIIADGHAVGNHTYNHLNGWKTDDELYIQNAMACQDALPSETRFFRPPYGRIKAKQAQILLKNNLQIVMWDVLTGDFEQYLSPQYCLHKTLTHTQEGSIVVMHDSQKAWRNMSYVLPRFLEEFSHKGYEFAVLPQVTSPKISTVRYE
jgi:peptidoglycan-N-acetylglucosamine deacetylase